MTNKNNMIKENRPTYLSGLLNKASKLEANIDKDFALADELSVFQETPASQIRHNKGLQKKFLDNPELANESYIGKKYASKHNTMYSHDDPYVVTEHEVGVALVKEAQTNILINNELKNNPERFKKMLEEEVPVFASYHEESISKGIELAHNLIKDHDFEKNIDALTLSIVSPNKKSAELLMDNSSFYSGQSNLGFLYQQFRIVDPNFDYRQLITISQNIPTNIFPLGMEKYPLVFSHGRQMYTFTSGMPNNDSNASKNISAIDTITFSGTYRHTSETLIDTNSANFLNGVTRPETTYALAKLLGDRTKHLYYAYRLDADKLIISGDESVGVKGLIRNTIGRTITTDATTAGIDFYDAGKAAAFVYFLKQCIHNLGTYKNGNFLVAYDTLIVSPVVYNHIRNGIAQITSQDTAGNANISTIFTSNQYMKALGIADGELKIICGSIINGLLADGEYMLLANMKEVVTFEQPLMQITSNLTNNTRGVQMPYVYSRTSPLIRDNASLASILVTNVALRGSVAPKGKSKIDLQGIDARIEKETGFATEIKDDKLEKQRLDALKDLESDINKGLKQAQKA